MDPNTTVTEARELVRRLLNAEQHINEAEKKSRDTSDQDSDHEVGVLQELIRELQSAYVDAQRLCDLWDAIDDWLGKGGFLPDAWKANR